METRGRVIGIDIGTTSTKTVVFTEKGKVVASHAVDYPIIQPKVGWAEQDPDVICAAVYKTVSVAIEKGNVLPEDISSIGISTAMHALIAVDKNGAPLTRSIIWADNRSTKQSEKLLQHMNGHDIYRRTGTPIHPMSPLSKLLWMKEEEPELYRGAYKFISIKEYVIYQLFSRYVVDYSIASATGLFNLETLNWDEEVLTMLHMSPEQLSKPVPTTYILSGMKPELAQKMGIREDTPVVIGASDGVLANVGVGAICLAQLQLQLVQVVQFEQFHQVLIQMKKEERFVMH